MEIEKIDLLNELESGKLTGGFSVAEGEDVSETSISNGNCGSETGWFNTNCACHACGATQKPIKTHK